MMSLPGCQRRAPERIEQALVADDPGLGLRFAVFTGLTGQEAIPRTEQVQARLQQVLRRAVIVPLVAMSLLALLLAAGGLIPSGQTCPVGQDATAPSISADPVS